MKEKIENLHDIIDWLKEETEGCDGKECPYCTKVNQSIKVLEQIISNTTIIKPLYNG